MKHNSLIILILMLLAFNSSAQNMKIFKTDGSIIDLKISEVDSILFIKTAEEISLDSYGFNGYIGNRYNITASCTPSTSDTDFEWSVSGNGITSITAMGSVCQILTTNYGIDTIKVKETYSGLTTYCIIKTVVEDFHWEVYTDEYYLNYYPQITLEVGEQYQLHYSCEPSYATNIFGDLNEFVFYDTNGVINYPTAISIDKNGLVTAITPGINGIKPTGRIIKGDGPERIYFNVVSSLPDYITMNTGNVETITPLSATLNTSFSGLENIIGVAFKCGVCYSEDPNPSINGLSQFTNSATSGTYSFSIKELKPLTTYYYRAVVYYGGNYYYGDTFSFKTPFLETDFNYVDLGLSVKWGTCNLGATSTEERGDYYAWGETETKSTFTKSTYQYYDSIADTYINIGSEISQTNYDAAKIKLGSRWKMPTYQETKELYDNCIWESATYQGVQGYLLTSKINGNYLFIRTTSCTNTASSKMKYSQFWTSTLSTEYSDSIAYAFYMNYSYFNVNNTYMARSSFREYGLPIRPVYK